jgi:hypothetical protein
MQMHEEEAAALAALQTLLDAMSRRDRAAMSATLVSEGSAVHSRDGRVFHETLAALVDRLPPGHQKIEERLGTPLVRVAQDIAMIWVDYEFFVADELHHWGTNIVTCLKVDGRWLVSGIADNGWSSPQP